MAKKESKNPFHPIIDTIKYAVSSVSDVLLSSVKSKVDEEADHLLDKVDKRMKAFQEQLLQHVQIMFIFGLGALAILGAVYFYLTDVLFISRSMVLFYLGLALVIIGLYLKTKYNK